MFTLVTVTLFGCLPSFVGIYSAVLTTSWWNFWPNMSADATTRTRVIVESDDLAML